MKYREKVVVYREFFYHLEESPIAFRTSGWISGLASKASGLSSNLEFSILYFRRLYKAIFSAICLFVQGGYLSLQVIVSCGTKFSKMFIIVSLKTENRLFTSRLEISTISTIFSQSFSNNQFFACRCNPDIS